jgi:hypothetical protein
MGGKSKAESKRKARLDAARIAVRKRRIATSIAIASVIIAALGLGVLNSTHVATGQGKGSVEMYKNPECNCCEWYANYLRNNGYSVVVRPTHNLSLVRREHGVPDRLAGCHTLLVGGYVVEGHVPIAVLDKLLLERPKIKGISLPGMPDGSPGMTGSKSGPFTIFEISDEQKIYAVE